MEEMILTITEYIPVIKGFILACGGGIVTLLLSKWLGKTKEEAEIVLNWEEIHEKRHQSLLLEIKSIKDSFEEYKEEREMAEALYKANISRLEEALESAINKCKGCTHVVN